MKVIVQITVIRRTEYMLNREMEHDDFEKLKVKLESDTRSEVRDAERTVNGWVGQSDWSDDDLESADQFEIVEP